MASGIEKTKDKQLPDHPPLDQEAGLKYWESITADNNGVLGGYPEVSKIDLATNTRFLTKLRRNSTVYPGNTKLQRVVDCGAGVGRVTKGFLSHVAEIVDIVEPVEKLTDVVTKGDDFKELREQGVIGKVFNVGLQDWKPETEYDTIWIQWCLGQLTDTQIVELLERITPFLKKGGWIVVKENQSTSPQGEDIFDETDNSLSRSDQKFRDLFKKAKLVLVSMEVQRGFPKELLPVKTYALQPQ